MGFNKSDILSDLIVDDIIAYRAATTVEKHARANVVDSLDTMMRGVVGRGLK